MQRIAALYLLSVIASGQTPETVLLGGSCLAESDSGPASIRTWHETVRRQLEADRRGNREAAFELAKQVVRGRCSNAHWWFRLAEAALQAKHAESATRALDIIHSRGINGILERLADPNSPLHALPATAAYRESGIAVKLENDRQALAQRRAQALALIETQPHPPDPYIAKGACPFECCKFGAWPVLKTTELYDRPNGAQAIGRAEKGTNVQALTGEVHLRPRPVYVRSAGPAPEGSIIYLLDYLGEGAGHIWTNGAVAMDEIAVGRDCTFPGPACWGEFVFPKDSEWVSDAVWWVKVKTQRGIVGWARWSRQFSVDCGCR